MPNDNSRNTIIFIVCALGLLLLYQVFVMGPAEKRAQADQKAKAAAEKTLPAAGAPGAPTGGAVLVPRAQALAASPRVPIKTDAVSGSIALKGGRIDDLFLTDYREKVEKNSPPVELFRPEGAQYAYFAETGWNGANLPGLPTKETVWTVKEGSTLAPGAPVTLSYDNGQGLEFLRKIEIDKEFMFTVTDTVINRSTMSMSLVPYGIVERRGIPTSIAANVHEGAVGVLGPADKHRLKYFKYKTWKKDLDQGKTGDYASATKGGWFGITDKYWLAALIPAKGESVNASFRVTPVAGVDTYDANFTGQARTIQPGFQASSQTHIFAGAKRAALLRGYSHTLGIDNFEGAIDWGNILRPITKPIFWLIELFKGWIGNFGIAILMMTVCVKVLFFYPANLSFASMTKMKKVQPQMEKIKERFKDDPAGQQQAMMQLYKEEKINPLLGCLPMLATIPVFFALYKVLSVTIEMRHAPFFGWINDLSARDPTTIWNLFGLIPFDPSVIPVLGGFLDGPLHLSAWAILYGFTMWLTQSMSPPAADPTQQKIIMFMPLIFTFVLAQLAAGLLIYYVWSNLLTIAQQYVIMRRYKVDNPIDKGIRRITGKPDPAPG